MTQQEFYEQCICRIILVSLLIGPSLTIHLTDFIGTPPTFMMEPPDRAIISDMLESLGDQRGNLIIPCEVTGTPTPTVKWFREGRELTGNFTVTTNGTLVAVVPYNDMAFRTGVLLHCEATNVFGANNSTATLRSRNVRVSYSYFGGFRNTVSQVVRLPAFEGQPLALECDFLHNTIPPPTISSIGWFNETGNKIDPITDFGRILYVEGGRYLFIRILTTDQLMQEYHCEVMISGRTEPEVAPTRYILNGTLPSPNFFIEYITQLGEITGQVGEDVVFVYAASHRINSRFQVVFLDCILPDYINVIVAVFHRYLATFNVPAPKGNTRITIRCQIFPSGVYRYGTVIVQGRANTTSSTEVDRGKLLGRGRVNYICPVHGGIPTPTVTWYYNGGRLPIGANVMGAYKNQQLTIFYPQISHSGIYQCFVSNNVGTDSRTWILEVRLPYINTVLPLNQSNPSTANDVLLGTIIVRPSGTINQMIIATLDSDPCPFVQWSLNGTAIMNDTTFSISDPCADSSARYHFNFTLTIANLTYATSGNYSATFSHSAMSVTLPLLYVTVQWPPYIEGNTPKLVYGNSTVTVRCADINIAREFILGREFLDFNGNQLTHNGVFRISRSDAGFYRCRLRFTDGNILYSSFFEVIVCDSNISSTQNLEEVRIGGTVVLSCNYCPIHSIYWAYNGLILSPNARLSISTNNSINSTQLTLRRVSLGDVTGPYACVFNNSADPIRVEISIMILPLLTLYYTRRIAGSISYTREQIENVVALDLRGQAANHSFECLSFHGGDNLAWEREEGPQRLPTHLVTDGRLLSISPLVESSDLGFFTCRDTVRGDNISIYIDGGPIGIRPEKHYFTEFLHASISLKVYTYGRPPVRLYEIHWFVSSGSRIGQEAFGEVYREGNTRVDIKFVAPRHDGYIRVVVNRLSPLANATTAIYIATIWDCQHPAGLTRFATSLEPVRSTLTNDTWLVQCRSGYTPVDPINITCRFIRSRLSYWWVPDPYSFCTPLRASANLTLIERRNFRPDIECPGDTISYKCGIISNTNYLQLTWVVTFLGLPPVSITYNAHSSLNTTDLLDRNISTTLTKFRARNYIESVIVLTLSKGINADGSVVQCNLGHIAIGELISVDSPVPPPPTNFNITRAHRTLLNATVTYEWDPPQSGVRGQEVIDSFEIVFVPSPLSHPSSNIINSSIWKFNVTLDINVLYNVTIASMNCVGSGRSVALNNIVINDYHKVTTTPMVHVLIGSSTSLICNYNLGSINATIYWMFRGSPLNPNDTRFIISTSNRLASLVLRRVIREDSTGRFACVIQSDLGLGTAKITLIIDPSLTLYHIKRVIGGHIMRTDIQNVVALDLGGQVANHSFECLSFYGGDNLVWEREDGPQRFPTHSVTDGRLLIIPQLVESSDLGLFICRDTVRGDNISIYIDGGSIAIWPEKNYHVAHEHDALSFKVHTYGEPPVRPDEIQWYRPTGYIIYVHQRLRIYLGENSTRLYITSADPADTGYFRAVITRTSPPANATAAIFMTVIVDCGNPTSYLTRLATPLEPVRSTVTNSTWLVQCDSGYTPINPINITCQYGYQVFFYRWHPNPRSVCVKLRASVNLTLVEKRSMQPGIDCLGDTILYNCSIVSNAYNLRLTWVVIFLGQPPITITYDADSVRDTVNLLGMNVSSTLTELRTSDYIESVITLTFLSDVSYVNKTMLECNFAGRTKDAENFSVYSPAIVPRPLTNFSITREYHTPLNITLTLEWNPPQGSGPDVIIDHYEITIVPTPLSHPTSNTVTALIWNVTVEYSLLYDITVTPVNCHGSGRSYSLNDIQFNYYHQVSTSQSLVSTRIGSSVSLSCNYNLGSINATIYWLFRGSPLDPNDTRFMISTSNRLASLVLRRVTREDSTGHFACVIQSDRGFGVAEIVLTIDPSLILYYIRMIIGGSTREQIENVVALDLGGQAANYSLECLSFYGGDNLVWEREEGPQRLPTHLVTDGRLLSISPPVESSDLGFFTCRDTVRGDNISIYIDGGPIGIRPEKHYFTAMLWEPVSLKVHTYGRPPVRPNEIQWFLPSGTRIGQQNFGEVYREGNTRVDITQVLPPHDGFIRAVVTRISPPTSATAAIYLATISDCRQPAGLTRFATSLGPVRSTVTNSTWLVQCQSGYTPIDPINITCTFIRRFFGYRWVPDPTSFCTQLRASVSLTFKERRNFQPDIDCPGDTISYICSIASNAYNLRLTWVVIFLGQPPITITYDADSVRDTVDLLGMNVSSTLMEFRARNYIESVITLTFLSDVYANKTMLECNFAGLTNDTENFSVYSPAIVPRPPTNFSITREYHTLFNITLTLEWNPPQGSGPDVIIDHYEITIVPTPLSHPTSNTVTALIWNVTVEYSLLYDITVTPVNCHGPGRSYSLNNIQINHYHQVSASQSLVSTRIGSNVSLSCNYNLGSINATVYWMFRGSPLDPNDTRFIISTSNRSASLVLRRVTREDSTGRFACVIQSDRGFGVAEIVLTIDRRSTREQIENVVALDLGGQAANYSLECLSFYGGDNLVWEREEGPQRLPTHLVTEGRLLSISPPVESSDLGFFTCRDTVRGDNISIYIDGGPIGIRPEKHYFTIILFEPVSLKVHTYGQPPVRPDEIQWFLPSGTRIGQRNWGEVYREGNTRVDIPQVLPPHDGFIRAVVTRTSPPASATAAIYIATIADCLQPAGLTRFATSLGPVQSTVTNSTWLVQCQSGYTPIDPINITCTFIRRFFGYRWVPDPTSFCTQLRASVSLTFKERRNFQPDMDCPGDTISYICSIASNAYNLRLTWVVIFLGQPPITITYDADSVRDTVNFLGMNVSSTLTEFRARNYIESVITLTFLSDVSYVNKTMLECNFAGLTNDAENFSIYSPAIVPHPLTNFSITREYHTPLNITLILEWNPPQGSGPDVIIDHYEITIVPTPLSHPTSNTVTALIWNVTVEYSLLYDITITPVNCHGSGRSYSLNNIQINHYHQVSASQSLVSTRIGSNVSLSCNYNLGSINATVYWMFRGSPLDPNDTRFIISTTSNRSASLVLRRVIREDSTGRFACVIQSDHGFGVAEIVLTIDPSLILFYIRTIIGGSTREQIENVVALDLRGQAANHSFECLSFYGGDNLVWEREEGPQRLPTHLVTDGRLLSISPPVESSDLGFFTCRDTVRGDNISIYIDGGPIGIRPEKHYFTEFLHANTSLKVYTYGRPPVRPDEIQWFLPSGNRLGIGRFNLGEVYREGNTRVDIPVVNPQHDGLISAVVTRTSPPASATAAIYIATIADCRNPAGLTRFASSLGPVQSTLTNSTWLVQCRSGYTPIDPINITCQIIRRFLRYRWVPDPTSFCTQLRASVSLTFKERRNFQPDMDCPGDTISYICSIASNAYNLRLTWVVIFLGQPPITITYNADSVRDTVDLLGMNVSSTLTEFRARNYIESVITLTFLSDVYANKTMLECNFAGLTNDTGNVSVYSPAVVPRSPTNFDITREYHTASNITMTLEWMPPQGSGLDVIIDHYEITIVPTPLSHPTFNNITTSFWNVTLDFNVPYDITVTPVNCAGLGRSTTLYNIRFIDCGIPLLPANRTVINYSGTKVGDSVMYRCSDGFRPSHEIKSTCTMFAMWQPILTQHVCSLITANITLIPAAGNILHCPGDNVVYFCFVSSNSEMLHLTWQITFPGLTPMNITYYNASLLGINYSLGMNVTAMLWSYLNPGIVEAFITFELKDATMNGTLLKCSIGPNLASEFTIWHTLVPSPPTNFRIVTELHGVTNITITFQWHPPQGSGPTGVVNSYEISIMPRPLSHPSSNAISSLSWNVTLNYNVEYTATITAENCIEMSRPVMLHNITFLDCGIPIPPINGSIVSYSGTKLGNIATFKCDEGFRPSAEVNGTCGSDARWNPAPNRHNCTFIEASVNLHLLERNEMSTIIDCPGDTIIYNCSILSNSEMVHLTWHVTFPGVMPINITYDSTSSINVMDTLDRNTSVILLQYEADQYIESVITFRLLKNISMNGTILLECGIAPHLGNDTAAIIVNTSVPLPPTNFSIAREYHEVLNITVTLEWVPPQGSGPSIIVDTYEITVTPEPLSGPVSNIISATSWNVTLNYNLIYTAVIAAENCAGVSSSVTLGNIEFLDCGIPRPPINGNIVQYIGTKVGDIVTYKCNEGYRPSTEMKGTCTMDAMWDPAPERHNCTFITASVSLSRLERNRNSTVIDCPEDGIIYNCSIQSNSEMIHLTWYITFPGHMPINITYYDNSSTMDVLDLNTSVILTQYRADQYIESVITITLLKNVTMNGTISLECGIAPYLGNDSANIPVNIAVPNPPTNFSISKEYHEVLNITITLEWIPPQGSGPNTIVDAYKVTIMPKPLSSPVSNIVRVTSWNVTLSYNSIYTAMIIAENCAGVSVPVTLGNIEFLDCGIPGPLISGSIVNFSGTKVGDTVTYKCNEGYRPSAEMNGTCTMDAMWDPAPERHNCTFIIASVSLSRLERNRNLTVIDCPEDSIIYNCSIQSNSEMIHLTWYITFPGHVPINITYYDNSSTMDVLDLNTSVILTQYRADQYIESVITITLLKNVTMNGTISLECGIAPYLGNDSANIPVNTAVPNPPTNFSISREYHKVHNITITLEWIPPQGSGPNTIVDAYKVTIMPKPLSSPVSNIIRVTSWNVTLSYNSIYTAMIIAENCAGVSVPVTLGNIEFLDCGIPGPPMNGSIVNFSGTKVGDIVTYKCNEGYRPSAEMNGTCGMNSLWDPLPERHNCTLVTASVAVSLLERNEISLDIDCPGDTIIYNCSILSNSETVHLTWSIDFPDLIPINLTFDGNSVPNNAVYLDFNVSVTLTEYRSDRYIESIIILTLLKNFSMNGTLVKCSIDPDLDSSSVIVPVNTPVLLAPSNFNIVERYDEVLNTTVAFEWDPPQGSGPERVVNNYTISITPRPVSHPIVSVVTSRFLNVTLNYNVEYTATVIAENCAGISSETVIRDIEYLDCGIPLSPINGSVLHYSGTKPGDYVTYKCNEGFRPSPAMNATCMSSDSRWSPLPERHNCIFIQATVKLNIHERTTLRPDIDCPGDTISFNCSIESNSESVELTWEITSPDELVPMSIIYNDTSLLNNRDQLDIYIDATLTKYMRHQSIESLITFTILKNISINGTELQCSSSDLESAAVKVLVNISAPLSPSGFNITKEYYSSVSNISVIFGWDFPPSGSGPKAVIDYYRISISPDPLSHPGLNVINSPPWNVTLSYNKKYTAIIIAENCAGESPPFTLYNIEYIDCGIPISPVNGYLRNWTGSKTGDTVNIQCNSGYIPSTVVNAICMNESGRGIWNPIPHEHICTLVIASASLKLVERNESVDNIDCPGDTIAYHCSITSNSETIHLTWTVNFPGLIPINITYDESSVLHEAVDHDDMGIKTVLTNYTYQGTIASDIVFKLIKNASMNGTKVTCSISPNLASSTLSFDVNTSVPLSATNLMIEDEYETTSNITVTLGWDPPQGTGPEVIVHNYEMVITPESLSHPNPIIVYSTSWNVTLDYNIIYSAVLTTVNCEGESSLLLLSNFTFIDCGPPKAPRNGYFFSYSRTTEGARVTFKCNDLFLPLGELITTCTGNGSWIPDPKGYCIHDLIAFKTNITLAPSVLTVIFALLGLLSVTVISTVFFYMMYKNSRRLRLAVYEDHDRKSSVRTLTAISVGYDCEVTNAHGLPFIGYIDTDSADSEHSRASRNVMQMSSDLLQISRSNSPRIY